MRPKRDRCGELFPAAPNGCGGIVMPIYEYKCDECGHLLEAIQKVNDAPLKECPACSRAALRRLISAGGFQLKGSGWYATDFKNKARKDSKPDQGKGDQAKQDQGKKDQADKSSSESGDTTPPKKAHSCGGGACGCT